VYNFLIHLFTTRHKAAHAKQAAEQSSENKGEMPKNKKKKNQQRDPTT
jgi:hypothetical protein